MSNFNNGFDSFRQRVPDFSQLRHHASTAHNAIKGFSTPQHFEYGLIVGKVAMIIAVLVLAYTNTDAAFIAVSPKQFLTESLLMGLCSAIPTVLVGYNRGAHSGAMINAFLISFLLFFMFNVLMELSGVNNYLTETKAAGVAIVDNVQQETIAAVEKPTWVKAIVGAFALVMITMAWYIYDFPGWKIFLIELVAFGVINSIPSYVMDKDRGNPNAMTDAAVTFAIFGGGYALLQMAGVFSEIFPKGHMNDAISSDLLAALE